jgi:hypothetical protein
LLRRFVREYYYKPPTTAVIFNFGRAKLLLSPSQTQDIQLGGSLALLARSKIDER